MSDLLKQGLGAKAVAEGNGNPNPTTTTELNNSTKVSDNPRGTDLLSKAGSNSGSAATEKTESASAKETKSASEVEPNEASVQDPSSWTKESALKEMKKAREEAKATRLKYEESVQKLKVESDARIAAVKKEQEELLKAKEELDNLKAKEEDKKRDLSEKLAHREALAAELRAQLEAKERIFKQDQENLKLELEKYRAEAQAQQKVYEQRLAQELESIPEKYRDTANLIVKGAGDPRDALIHLNEAKLKGLFDDKTVVVNHSVPGAHEGARATKERLDAAASAERAKMSSSQKISAGLKGIRQGETNSAFRVR